MMKKIKTEKERGFILLCLSAIILSKLLDIFLRYILGKIIDSIQSNAIISDMSFEILVMSVLFIILAFIVPYLNERISSSLLADIHDQLEKKILHFMLSYFNKIDHGNLISLYNSDAYGYVAGVSRVITNFIPGIILFIISEIFIAMIDIKICIVSIIIVLISSMLVIILSKKIVIGTKHFQEVTDRINKDFATAVYNIEMAKSLKIESRFIEQDNLNSIDINIKKSILSLYNILLSIPSLIIAFIVTAIVMFISGYEYRNNSISIGNIITIITLLQYLINPIMTLDSTLVAIQKAKVNIKRMNTFMGYEDESLEKHLSKRDTKISNIKFDKVTFKYNDDYVLKNLCCEFRSGSINYIQGRNGIGKSSIIKLLTRVYAVDSGYILINGNPIEKYSIAFIRDFISVMTQQEVFMPDTLINNLCIGKPENIENIIELTKLFNVYDSIMRQPNAFDSIMNENSYVFSKGERQRLSFIRTVSKDAFIYVFDEPTSALDKQSSIIVWNAIEHLSLEKIVIVITHEKPGNCIDDSILQLET